VNETYGIGPPREFTAPLNCGVNTTAKERLVDTLALFQLNTRARIPDCGLNAAHARNEPSEARTETVSPGVGSPGDTLDRTRKDLRMSAWRPRSLGMLRRN
jgi:hypothetical protein